MSELITRRQWVQQGASTGAALLLGPVLSRTLLAQTTTKPAFTMMLSCGSIGVRADQLRAIHLAKEFGYSSVSADASYLAALDDSANAKLIDKMKQDGVVWGTASLPVRVHSDAASFSRSLEELPRLAKGLQRAGVTRMGTWVSPSHAKLTYRENFRLHVDRLGACAKILDAYDIRLGLEYIGPKTLWASKRHSFVHSMAETKELIGDIGLDNMGFVLDSWHWYTAHETVDDLRTLSNHDVVSCDLNDAPAGIPIDEQIDSRRELPAATGVIDIHAFLMALVEIGYDGPIRAEPFNQKLNDMEDEAAVATTARAMREAFATVGA